MERALPKLAHRTISEFHQIHLAETSRGFFCLDFNAWFDSIDSFNEWVVPRIQSMPLDEILPSAPEQLWREYMDLALFTMTTQYSLSAEVAHYRGPRRVVICKGEFS